MTANNPNPILVIGAGLSGIAVGRLLTNNGIANVVFEALPPGRSQGFAISLHDWGYNPLLEALGGLSLRSLTKAVAPDRLLRGSGWVDLAMRDNTTGEVLVGPDADARPAVMRANRNALRAWMADCGEEELDVRYGHRLKSIFGSTGNMTVVFENGAEYHGALVIAADGVHSTAKAQILPHIVPDIVPVVVYHELFMRPQWPCDIHNWVQYFAFDAVLEMTMSRNLGFMKAGGDVEGVLKQLQRDLEYRGIALAMPIIDRIWRLNPLSKLFKPDQSGHFAMRCKRILEDRIEQEKLDMAPQQTDFARRFLEAQRRDPSISDGQLIGYMQANLINPWIYSRLIDELDSYSNLLIPVPFRIARFELPFCAAVIRESLRKHFAFIGMMERETPPAGV
ncbi:hypothetical protein BDV19DRAFT_384118 [Aspergillus venezuelensis]